MDKNTVYIRFFLPSIKNVDTLILMFVRKKERKNPRLLVRRINLKIFITPNFLTINSFNVDARYNFLNF